MTLSHTTFVQVQAQFHRIVQSSPLCANLVIVESTPEAGSYDTLMGNSTRSITKEVPLKVLFNRNVDDNTRTKFGLSEDVSGVLYVSPIDLIIATGSWKLDGRKLKVQFLEETYLVKRVHYISNVPKFSSCLAVEIRLYDDIHGL